VDPQNNEVGGGNHPKATLGVSIYPIWVMYREASIVKIIFLWDYFPFNYCRIILGT
jgi:hypothetical protein